MRTVYVTQRPPNPDVDMSGLSKFGEVVYVFPTGTQPVPGDNSELIEMARAKMEDMSPGDYVVLNGSPGAMLAHAIVASECCEGYLTLLSWDRRAKHYTVGNFEFGWE